LQKTKHAATVGADRIRHQEVEQTMILRRVARPLLASIFITGGIEQLRNPEPRAEAAAPVLDATIGQVQDKLPDQVPTDTMSLVKIDGAVKVGAGLMLALGKFPRLSALLLAGSIIPTTAAGHRFWEYEDPKERAAQQIHFFKNLGLLGGLMLASADTHGKPSVAYRTKKAAKHAAASVSDTASTVQNKLPW
jgi:putative oxidoreductase